MSYAADLHVHSRHAMGASRALSLETLAWWGGMKGVGLLASGDFTHPAWLAELKRKLRPADDGLFDLVHPGGAPPVKDLGDRPRFVLGTEVSCVYEQRGRGRRVHLLVLAPGFEAVDGLCAAFAPYGALEPDGRPTLRLSARDLTGAVLAVDSRCEVIAAHAWTPWFSAYGSRGGFDSLDECFGDMAAHVHAIESGLSSDPSMNWRVPDLDGRTIVSFSDAHSAPRIGRELTVFSGEPGYDALTAALRAGGVEWTAEFYPEEGKYHYDGHRKCGVRQHPAVTRERGERCPACRRPLTLGVLHRMESLADRPSEELVRSEGGALRDAAGARPPFRRLVPLEEIVAEAVGRRTGAKAVRSVYFDLVERVGPELDILASADASAIEAVAGERVAEGVMRARLGRVTVSPGFDGEYGRVRLWNGK